MANPKTIKILKAIEQKYKNLETPNFSFIEKIASKRPYDSLLKKMKPFFLVEEEDVDTNYEVSFGYLLSSPGGKWAIELSMLGYYAVILRCADTKNIQVVDTDNSFPEEQKICALLKEDGFEILTQQVLEQPVPLKLNYTDPENVRIYQALFADVDFLPWE